MIADWTTLQVLAVLFLATFVRSAFGFGEALIAVPLLALIMPMDVAAPVAVLISITVAVVVLAQDWRHVHGRSAGWLILSTLVGTPLGLLLLTKVEGSIVKACLGIIIVAFSTYSLLDRKRMALKDDRWAWSFGFGAGVLGGAYGMNGPPLVMYGALRGWSPQRFRATLQGYFLPAGLMTLAGYWLAGLWKPIVNHYYLISLPAVLVAIFLGRAFSGRMDERTFLRYIHFGLLVVGGMLLLHAVADRTYPCRLHLALADRTQPVPIALSRCRSTRADAPALRRRSGQAYAPAAAHTNNGNCGNATKGIERDYQHTDEGDGRDVRSVHAGPMGGAGGRADERGKGEAAHVHLLRELGDSTRSLGRDGKGEIGQRQNSRSGNLQRNARRLRK